MLKWGHWDVCMGPYMAAHRILHGPFMATITWPYDSHTWAIYGHLVWPWHGLYMANYKWTIHEPCMGQTWVLHGQPLVPTWLSNGWSNHALNLPSICFDTAINPIELTVPMKYSMIGLDNGLPPNHHQAIIKTSFDIVFGNPESNSNGILVKMLILFIENNSFQIAFCRYQSFRLWKLNDLNNQNINNYISMKTQSKTKPLPRPIINL